MTPYFRLLSKLTNPLIELSSQEDERFCFLYLFLQNFPRSVNFLHKFIFDSLRSGFGGHQGKLKPPTGSGF